VSVVREAVVLPLLFLTVVLCGALRPGPPVAVVPPSLFSLVLAVLLLAALVQSGTVAPARLVHGRRSRLANVNGAVVLVTLLLASAQVCTLLIPPAGAPAVLMGLALLVLLALLLALGADRVRLLRGLLVAFGAAFTLRYVVLAALSAPAQGAVARALQLLFEGATLGTVSQPVDPPSAGYLAFVTLGTYLIGLALLPAAGWTFTRVGVDRQLED
jgi:hypothetical protein